MQLFGCGRVWVRGGGTGVSCTAAEEIREYTSTLLYIGFGKLLVSSSDPPLTVGSECTGRGRVQGLIITLFALGLDSVVVNPCFESTAIETFFTACSSATFCHLFSTLTTLLRSLCALVKKKINQSATASHEVRGR